MFDLGETIVDRSGLDEAPVFGVRQCLIHEVEINTPIRKVASDRLDFGIGFTERWARQATGNHHSMLCLEQTGGWNKFAIHVVDF